MYVCFCLGTRGCYKDLCVVAEILWDARVFATAVLNPLATAPSSVQNWRISAWVANTQNCDCLIIWLFWPYDPTFSWSRSEEQNAQDETRSAFQKHCSNIHQMPFIGWTGWAASIQWSQRFGTVKPFLLLLQFLCRLPLLNTPCSWSAFIRRLGRLHLCQRGWGSKTIHNYKMPLKAPCYVDRYFHPSDHPLKTVYPYRDVWWQNSQAFNEAPPSLKVVKQRSPILKSLSTIVQSSLLTTFPVVLHKTWNSIKKSVFPQS
jgi:hypothetical protein